MALGWIYILSNPSMPGLVKIGYSTKDPELRLRELDGTGIPTPFEIIFWALVDEPYALEQSLHDHLDNHRVSQQREFFKLNVADSVNFVIKFIKDKNIDVKLELNNTPFEEKELSPSTSKIPNDYDFKSWIYKCEFESFDELIDSAKEKYSTDSVKRCFYVMLGLRHRRPLLCLDAITEPYERNLSIAEYDLVAFLYLNYSKFIKNYSDYKILLDTYKTPKPVEGEYEGFTRNISEIQLTNLKELFNGYKENILLRKIANKFPSKKIYLLYELWQGSLEPQELISPLRIPDCRHLLQELVKNANDIENINLVVNTIRRFLNIVPQVWFNDKPYMDVCKLSVEFFDKARIQKSEEYIDLIIDLGVHFNERWDFSDSYVLHNKFLRELISSDLFMKLCNSSRDRLPRFGDAESKLSSLSSESNFPKNIPRYFNE
jgi:hypothetical protein